MIDNLNILAVLTYGFGLILSLAALIIIPRNRKPSAGMAWLLVIFLVPYVGWVLFLILGTNKLPRKYRNSQDKLDKLIDTKITDIETTMSACVPAKFQPVAKLASALGHLPPISGHTTDYITDYSESIAKITEAIDEAASSVYLEYYIFTRDEATEPVLQALARAKRRGVEVRVLFDWWGSRGYKSYKLLLEFLDEHHIAHHPMLKFTISFKNYLRIDLRNHRKLIVIDQEIGFIGSQNLIARNYARKDSIVYDELVVRLTGDIVRELSALFAYDWSLESTIKPKHITMTKLASTSIDNASLLQILPSGPSYSDVNNLKVFTMAINRAEHEVFIANPYYVPPEPLASAILSAVKRGVRVRMINSEAIDQWMVGHAQRSHYDEMLQAGVEIYLYKKPTLLHSKFMLIDNEMAIVGSSNLDIRSFELDQELSLIIYDEKSVQPLFKVRDTYLERSRPLRLVTWRKRKLFPQFLDSVARLTSNIQ